MARKHHENSIGGSSGYETEGIDATIIHHLYNMAKKLWQLDVDREIYLELRVVLLLHSNRKGSVRELSNLVHSSASTQTNFQDVSFSVPTPQSCWRYTKLADSASIVTCLIRCRIPPLASLKVVTDFARGLSGLRLFAAMVENELVVASNPAKLVAVRGDRSRARRHSVIETNDLLKGPFSRFG